MRPRILIIYYSQTGQLKKIIDQLLSPIAQYCEIEVAEVKPKKPFPFPWTSEVFFDCMPESVQLISEEIEPIEKPPGSFDLVILGYQPWFLSPSIPINSFLQSKYAGILRNQNVLTIIGSRNMWLNAQEKVKQRLLDLEAQLVGNIVFFDRSPNLLSILTIIRWSFKGQKEATRFMPEAGVQQKDIQNADRFGEMILSAMQNQQFSTLHQQLLERDAVELQPGLVVLEKRGIKNFRKFSTFILEKGNRGDIARKSRVVLFKRLLIIGVFILSPISNVTAKLTVLFKKKALEKEVEYFKNIGYKKNAI